VRGMRPDNRYRVGWLSPNTKFSIRKFVLQPVALALFPFAAISGLVFFGWVSRRPTVFIVGASRSGTTVFADSLSKASWLSEWSEAALVFNPCYFFKHADDHKLRFNLLEKGWIYFWLGIFLSFKPRNMIFLNKHPQNSYKVTALRNLFKSVKFIHLIRDGYCVIASNLCEIRSNNFRKDRPFGGFPKPRNWREIEGTDLEKQCVYWVDVLTHLRRFGSEHSSIYLEVLFENFIAEPNQTLKTVTAFLGQDAAPPAVATKLYNRKPADAVAHFSEDELTKIVELIEPTNKRIQGINTIKYQCG